MNKVYISETKHNGKGIFAGENIGEDEEIFTINGKVISTFYIPFLSWIGKRWIGIGRNKWIKPNKDNFIYYTNHSCSPNSEIKDKVKLIALRDIKKLEEITFDYSKTEADPYWKMECKCGSKNCKKVITGEAKWQ